MTIGQFILAQQLGKVEKFDSKSDEDSAIPVPPVSDLTVANVVTSRLKTSENLHRPALDIDIPSYLIRSTTEGHHHLYIDKVITWNEYKMLLITMAAIGILDDGYVAASIARGHTTLRLPWIQKEAQPQVPMFPTE